MAQLLRILSESCVFTLEKESGSLFRVPEHGEVFSLAFGSMLVGLGQSRRLKGGGIRDKVSITVFHSELFGGN